MQVVLNVSGVVGQRGANVVGLKQTQAPVFCEVIVEAATCLQRKRVGARCGGRAGRIDAVKAVHASQNPLDEDLIVRIGRGSGMVGPRAA